ncbi:hypothetical protein HPB50_028864 [Hyalomma asiaticum]|nr:hypothetical protein HPB50_028864 [Hyalomma asiaticum]
MARRSRLGEVRRRLPSDHSGEPYSPEAMAWHSRLDRVRRRLFPDHSSEPSSPGAMAAHRSRLNKVRPKLFPDHSSEPPSPGAMARRARLDRVRRRWSPDDKSERPGTGAMTRRPQLGGVRRKQFSDRSNEPLTIAEMARRSRLDEVRRRLFSDDTSEPRPRKVCRTTSTVTGARTSLYKDETPPGRFARRQQEEQYQKLVADGGDQPKDGSEGEARFLQIPFHGMCSKVSFNSVWPTGDESNDFASYQSPAGSKTLGSYIAEHNAFESRKQHRQISDCLDQSDFIVPFADAGKQNGELSALARKLKARSSRLAVPLAGKISTSRERKAGLREGGLLENPAIEARGPATSDVDLGESAFKHRSPSASRYSQDSSAYSTVAAPDVGITKVTWNTTHTMKTHDLIRAASYSVDRNDSVDLCLANPLEVTLSLNGHVVEQHAQDPRIDIHDVSSATSHGLQSVLPGFTAVGSEKSELTKTTVLPKCGTTVSSKCATYSSTEDRVQSCAYSESTPPSLPSVQLRSNSMETGAYRVSMPVLEKQGNQAFGDCSENSPKTLQPLRKAIEQLSPLRGECDADVVSVGTYICHEMRKGGLSKNVWTVNNRIADDGIQHGARSPNNDLVRQPEGSELALLECPSPSARTGEGKPLLKMLKASGASGAAPTGKILHLTQVLAHTRGQDSTAPRSEKQGTSSTPFCESAAVEEQQPFKRVVLFRKNLVVCPGMAIIALALIASTVASILYGKVIATKKPQSFAFQGPKPLLIAKNGSLVGQGTFKDEYDTCSTPACKRDGAYLKGLLSWDLDPCEDFYRFVCSRWKGGGETSKVDMAVAASDELSHQLEQNVHRLLQRSSSPENLGTLKALFYECMNTRQLDLDDWNPMLELLWLVGLEGFPFSFTPRNSTSLWKIAARALKMTGAEALISIRATENPTKDGAGILSIGLPTMLAPKGSDQSQVTQFYNSTAFACITALKKQRNPTVYSLEVAAFASRLEMLVYSYTVLAGPQTRRITPLKTQPELSTFLVELFLNSDSPLYTELRTELLIQSPAFFDALVTLLRNTEQYVVMNYLGTRLMIEVAAYAPSSGRPLVHTLVQHMYGRPRPSLPRWKLCVRSVERALPDLFLHASGLAFQTHFALDMVQRLLESLRLQLVRSLSRLAILDRDSRARAKTLLNSTRFLLFRPHWLNNHEKLESYLTALPRVVRGQSLRSFYTLHSHSFTENLRRDEADRWQGSAFDHDCTFDGHTVYVPVLLFNFTLFTSNADQGLQLPNSGVRIVRCLLQLLVSSVARGGHMSAVTSRVWWPDMSSSFLAVTQLCFQQYGVRKLGPLELLQHTAAIEPAMDLFQEEKRIDVRLETFQTYSSFHLFFVYYALSFCEESSADNTTESTMAAFLTNVPLWNNRQFQETFRCPVGSYMNPSQKCVLWRSVN